MVSIPPTNASSPVDEYCILASLAESRTGETFMHHMGISKSDLSSYQFSWTNRTLKYSHDLVSHVLTKTGSRMHLPVNALHEQCSRFVRSTEIFIEVYSSVVGVCADARNLGASTLSSTQQCAASAQALNLGASMLKLGASTFKLSASTLNVCAIIFLACATGHQPVIKILNCDWRSTRVRYLWSSAVSLVTELFFRFLSPSSDSLTMVFVSNN